MGEFQKEYCNTCLSTKPVVNIAENSGKYDLLSKLQTCLPTVHLEGGPRQFFMCAACIFHVEDFNLFREVCIENFSLLSGFPERRYKDEITENSEEVTSESWESITSNQTSDHMSIDENNQDIIHSHGNHSPTIAEHTSDESCDFNDYSSANELCNDGNQDPVEKSACVVGKANSLQGSINTNSNKSVENDKTKGKAATCKKNRAVQKRMRGRKHSKYKYLKEMVVPYSKKNTAKERKNNLKKLKVRKRLNEGKECHSYREPQREDNHQDNSCATKSTSNSYSIFQCDYCCKIFTQKSTLRTHMNLFHVANQLYTCDICARSFNAKHNLEDHMKIHTGEKQQYLCKVCGKDLKSKHYLQQHMNLHSRGKQLCDICGLSFVLVSNLNNHKKSQHKVLVEEFVCDICKSRFVNKSLLFAHIQRVHIKSRDFGCSSCDRKFFDKKDLQVHMERHRMQKTHICVTCKKGFITSTDLRNHVKLHTKKKHFQCSICSKFYSNKYDMRLHEMQHKSVVRYVCEVCGNSYGSSATLYTHKKIHSGEKHFICNYCGDGFFRKHVLERHIRTHTGEKPYSCSMCERKFACNKSLMCHERIHTGAKPYNCNICGQNFRQSSILGCHRRRIHNCK